MMAQFELCWLWIADNDTGGISLQYYSDYFGLLSLCVYNLRYKFHANNKTVFDLEREILAENWAQECGQLIKWNLMVDYFISKNVPRINNFFTLKCTQSQTNKKSCKKTVYSMFVNLLLKF